MLFVFSTPERGATQPVSSGHSIFRATGALHMGIESIDRTYATLLYDHPHIRGYDLGGLHVQLIKGRYFRSLREMVESFDFTVCSIGVSYGGEIEYHNQFFAALWSMTLRANCMSCPTNSLARMVRYMGKGFTPGEGLLTTLTRAVARQRTRKTQVKTAWSSMPAVRLVSNPFD